MERIRDLWHTVVNTLRVSLLTKPDLAQDLLESQRDSYLDALMESLERDHAT